MGDLPDKALRAVEMFNAGAVIGDIADELGVKRATVRAYIAWVRRLTDVPVKSRSKGARYKPLRPIAGTHRKVGVRVSADLSAILEAEALRREQAVAGLIMDIVAAVVDGDGIAAVLDGEG